MKRAVFSVGLALAAFGLGLAVGLFVRRQPPLPAAPKTSQSELPERETADHVTELTFSAVIDGTDRFIFTKDMAWNEHLTWNLPRNVTLNGEAWSDLTAPPARWAEIVKDLDLTKATIATRNGRDVIALEHTADGFDLYFVDNPSGSGTYEVTILVPHKQSLPRTGR